MIPYFAGQHTPTGHCDFYCGACYRLGPGGVYQSLGGVALCGTCHSLFVRDVELYKHERMAQLRKDAVALVTIALTSAQPRTTALTSAQPRTT